MKNRRLFALPLLALTATSAWAQDSAMCRNGLFAQDPPFALATVNGAEPAYFHDDRDGCPRIGGGCILESHVAPGGTVIVSKVLKGLACIFDPGDDGGTAGWVEAKRLDLQRIETNPPLAGWLGKWRSAGNPELVFTSRLGQLHVNGRAFWPGPPGTTDWPSIHEGAIDGAVDRTGHRGAYDGDRWCEAKFTLLGDYLIAGDNNKCGGANVSFSAVYRRVEE